MMRAVRLHHRGEGAIAQAADDGVMRLCFTTCWNRPPALNGFLSYNVVGAARDDLGREFT